MCSIMLVLEMTAVRNVVLLLGYTWILFLVNCYLYGPAPDWRPYYAYTPQNVAVVKGQALVRFDCGPKHSKLWWMNKGSDQSTRITFPDFSIVPELKDAGYATLSDDVALNLTVPMGTTSHTVTTFICAHGNNIFARAVLIVVGRKPKCSWDLPPGGEALSPGDIITVRCVIEKSDSYPPVLTLYREDVLVTMVTQGTDVSDASVSSVAMAVSVKASVNDSGSRYRAEVGYKVDSILLSQWKDKTYFDAQNHAILSVFQSPPVTVKAASETDEETTLVISAGIPAMVLLVVGGIAGFIVFQRCRHRFIRRTKVQALLLSDQEKEAAEQQEGDADDGPVPKKEEAHDEEVHEGNINVNIAEEVEEEASVKQ